MFFIAIRVHEGTMLPSGKQVNCSISEAPNKHGRKYEMNLPSAYTKLTAKLI